VVVLAVDGIGCEVARRAWRGAGIEEMSSVFPTTSSSSWLSSITGMSVDLHGVPGVVFTTPDGGDRPVNVFDYRGPLFEAPFESVFSDAASLGCSVVSITGDLDDFDCEWKARLLEHSRNISGPRIYSAESADALPAPGVLCERVRRSIDEALSSAPRGAPSLIWCFMDVDLHVHRHGYDEHAMEFLAGLDRLASELAERRCVVIAHSDHGLTPTENDPWLETFLDGVARRHGCAVGGAGRCRWLYAQAGRDDAVREALADGLPADVRLVDADDLFAAGSLARRRVGSSVLIATGRHFVTAADYTHDHGSLTPPEVAVPFAQWRG
jgi:predicted AlkP superfamily pyrophosphatase or phosphodiesterase